MAQSMPYTYIQCPCSDVSTLLRGADGPSKRDSATIARGTATRTAVDGEDGDGDEDDDDGRTFDPRAPRANFSLYPLEYLLYCEDCHQIRCPRCVNEEIVTYFCPNCLFEVPASNLKSEGNRCTRSCFQCPICIGPLSVSSLEPSADPNLLSADNAGVAAAPAASSYILTCSYCAWTSTEIGIRFDKPNGIHAQLARLDNGGGRRLTPKDVRDRKREKPDDPPPSRAEMLDPELRFAALKSFYQSQLAAASPSGGVGSGLGDLGFSSPGSLSRIMNLYTGSGSGSSAAALLADKRARARAHTVREASSPAEGLIVADLDDAAAIRKLHRLGLDSTASVEQRLRQPDDARAARFADQLRPVPYLLRTKRSKRCPACRHIISKPEAKVSTTRFRIRLVAGSYIPSIAIRPLGSSSAPAGPMTPTASSARSPIPVTLTQPELLTPFKPTQFLLTFTNPIFDPVKVTLATPAKTPGRFASAVTVLCPQFEIGANSDDDDRWDDALRDDPGGSADQRRRRGAAGLGEDGAEAGKVWERGRNWVSIVIEVVPASLRLDTLTAAPGDEVDRSPLKEDEDMLEIPMFVRIEWESDAQHEVGAAPGKDKESEKRELAYWSVLGLGRISRE